MRRDLHRHALQPVVGAERGQGEPLVAVAELQPALLEVLVDGVQASGGEQVGQVDAVDQEDVGAETAPAREVPSDEADTDAEGDAEDGADGDGEGVAANARSSRAIAWARSS